MDVQNPYSLESISDLTQLLHLSESSVLETLHARYSKKFMYTRCGIILLAVNPFEELHIYGQQVIDAYRNGHPSLDPHIFAVAEEAFSRLDREGANQSIVISGESGSGKTMSAKYVMRYLASAGGSLAETDVEKKILASSPVMEAFGNATTLQNKNSSRFGKFVQINFGAGYNIVGAQMRTYLLEKSRVVCHGSGERNYHIFHQLCAAVELPEFSELKLDRAANFRYTGPGQNADDDFDRFQETRGALSKLGFSEKEQLQMFGILSAILHLGNVEIASTDEGKSMIPQQELALKNAMDLLGLDGDYRNQFLQCLIQRKSKAGTEDMIKDLTVKEATSGRDALSKHIYAHLFKWIVGKVNEALASSKETQRFIGILDIYGFETFEVNSFEQFCINYANEKLQCQFNELVFRCQRKEHKDEGINWKKFDFEENQPCIDLIEGKAGILTLLDDQCKQQYGSDKSWLASMSDSFGTHSHYQKPENPKKLDSAFVIRHYAGDVQYEITGFVEKNRDRVDKEQERQEISIPVEADLKVTLSDSEETSLTVAQFDEEPEKLKDNEVEQESPLKPDEKMENQHLDRKAMVAVSKLLSTTEVYLIQSQDFKLAENTKHDQLYEMYEEARGVVTTVRNQLKQVLRKDRSDVTVDEFIDNDTLERIVAEFTPKMAKTCQQPCTPADKIFLAMEQRASMGDEEGINQVFTNSILAIDGALMEERETAANWILWLANVSHLLNRLEQSGSDKYFALSYFRRILKKRAISMQSRLLRIVKNNLTPHILPAVIRHYPPSSDELRGPEMSSMLVKSQLEIVLTFCKELGVDQPLRTQIFKQIFYYISSTAVNGLLLRKDMCTFWNGSRISFNVKSMKEWIKDNVVKDDDGLASILETLVPLTQAAQALTIQKDVSTAEYFVGFMDKLNPHQILKLLYSYTPCENFDTPVPHSFIEKVEKILSTRENFYNPALLMDVNKML